MINTFENTVEKLNIYEALESELLLNDEYKYKYVNANIMTNIKNIMLPRRMKDLNHHTVESLKSLINNKQNEVLYE